MPDPSGPAGARVFAALIRHGDYHQLRDAPSAHQPFPLNEDGEAQARDAVSGLRRDVTAHGWTLHPVIDSSRLLRAWQTAGIIAAGLEPLQSEAPVVESFDELAERGVGSAANLTTYQIEESRKKEGLDGYGAGVTIVRPEGLVLGISTDFPYAKVFRPEGPGIEGPE